MDGDVEYFFSFRLKVERIYFHLDDDDFWRSILPASAFGSFGDFVPSMKLMSFVSESLATRHPN